LLSSKSEEILLEYFKTPFDEEDAQKIIGAENPVKSATEVAIIWGMQKAGQLLGDYYEDAEETLQAILRDEIEIEIEAEQVDFVDGYYKAVVREANDAFDKKAIELAMGVEPEEEEFDL